ncbi:hypothetical protein R3P38DRAFT_3416401, partial [Favolaschia claudopus]
MLDGSVRLSSVWNTVVKIHPDFTIPPSDPDPLHHFSTRNCRSVNNMNSCIGTSINSLASLKRGSTLPLATKTPTPRKTRVQANTCCCACHAPVPASPNTPTRKASNLHADIMARSLSVRPILHRVRVPLRIQDRWAARCCFVSSARRSGRKSYTVHRVQAGTDGYDVDRSMAVSEMGEISFRARPIPVSKISPSTKEKQPAKPPPKVGSYSKFVIFLPRSAFSRRLPIATDCFQADDSFLFMSSNEGKNTGTRRLRRSDRSIVLVNRFGWPLSASPTSQRKTSDSVPARSGPVAVSDPKNFTSPARSRASFEVDLSPILEDVPSFPTHSDLNSNSDPFSISSHIDEHTTHNNQGQGYLEEDSRNFEHMNLSGSFILQSTSCHDINKGSCTGKHEKESPPALVLTFPTPEPPTSPVFEPQLSPFAVINFSAPDASSNHIQYGGSHLLAVPTIPRCTHCGFGFGLDLHDLEMPMKSIPCRFCEPQWLACKTWRETGGNNRGNALQPTDNGRRPMDTGDKLGLPIGSHRSTRRRTTLPVADELGQIGTGNNMQSSRTEGYSRFSNVIVKDRTRTSNHRVVMVWKKITRLFGTHE